MSGAAGVILSYKTFYISRNFGCQYLFFTPEEFHICSKGDGTRTIFPSRDNPVFQGNIGMGGD
ncbi:MAG: hypothetical protein RBS55_00360 [Bacteroidales bacterium]|jgi:hypothetical protein|nr:hypothetical protein [Bacteroidales bacterium]